MQVCNPDCVTTAFPDMSWVNGCNITTRMGGIPRLTFLKCVPDLVLPNEGGWANTDNIQWAICQGYLFVTGDLLGQKPKGSFTKRRLSSCAPEQTIAGSKTVTAQDFNADVDNLLDFDFWGAVVDNKRFMKFGWITCDGRWYQYDGEWDVEVDEVIEDTKDGKSFYDILITMATKDLVTPILVPGILELFKAQTATTCYS